MRVALASCCPQCGRQRKVAWAAAYCARLRKCTRLITAARLLLWQLCCFGEVANGWRSMHAKQQLKHSSTNGRPCCV